MGRRHRFCTEQLHSSCRSDPQPIGIRKKWGDFPDHALDAQQINTLARPEMARNMPGEVRAVCVAAAPLFSLVVESSLICINIEDFPYCTKPSIEVLWDL